MREKGIQAYLVLTHDDYTYFFGEDRYQPRAIVPAAGPPIIVASRGEEEEIRASLGVSHVRVFSTVGQQIKDVVDVMRDLVGEQMTLTVGVQMGFGTPAFLVNLFQKANPKVRVVDVAPVMDELRMVKDPEEVALMRQAGEIAAIGMQSAARTIRPGVVENDVAAEIEYAMRKAGGHGTATPVFVNSGHRSCWLHGTATEKEIAEGDLVVVDVVPRFRGYCANMCRTFVAGAPSPRQVELHDAYRRAQAAAIEMLRPGVRVRDIDAAAKEVFDTAGFGERFVPGISHSIGLAFEEAPAPAIHPTHAAMEVRAGMTVTVGHSVLAFPRVGGVRIEDTFHVTAAGIEPLTEYSKDLVVRSD
jgi:Xaa-Pro aminopeptidase